MEKRKKRVSRTDSDEYYVIDLCDEILGMKAVRQYNKFDFLRGDGTQGRRLPVDAYYPELNLVVEYHERQHTESVAFFNKKTTVSGVNRDEQRRIYDQRRRDVLPKHGIRLVEIPYSALKHNSSKRLMRDWQADMKVIQELLSQPHTTNRKDEQERTREALPNKAKARIVGKKNAKDGTKTCIFGCLFMIAVEIGTVFLSSYLTLSVFHLDEGLALIIVILTMFAVSFICHFYTTKVDGKRNNMSGHSKRKVNSSTYSNAASYPVCCPQCGSNNIGPTDGNAFGCMDCGLQWYQTYNH